MNWIVLANPVLQAMISVHSFNGSNGSYPVGPLIANTSGNLFGTTFLGVVNNDGTVFELQNIGTLTAPVYASTPTTLVGFNGSNGAGPAFGALIENANGDLFGTTQNGGANNLGTVFEIQNIGTLAAPVYASTPLTLVSFDGLNGKSPDAGLTADANGNLFGTTSGDGTTSYGS